MSTGTNSIFMDFPTALLPFAHNGDVAETLRLAESQARWCRAVLEGEGVALIDVVFLVVSRSHYVARTKTTSLTPSQNVVFLAVRGLLVPGGVRGAALRAGA